MKPREVSAPPRARLASCCDLARPAGIPAPPWCIDNRCILRLNAPLCAEGNASSPRSICGGVRAWDWWWSGLGFHRGTVRPKCGWRSLGICALRFAQERLSLPIPERRCWARSGFVRALQLFTTSPVLHVGHTLAQECSALCATFPQDLNPRVPRLRAKTQ